MRHPPTPAEEIDQQGCVISMTCDQTGAGTPQERKKKAAQKKKGVAQKMKHFAATHPKTVKTVVVTVQVLTFASGFLDGGASDAALPLEEAAGEALEAEVEGAAEDLGAATETEVADAEIEPLVRDATGKIHGEVPDHVPENWTKEQMEEVEGELKESIKARNAEQTRYGEDGGHRERIRQEQGLLRQIQKKLSGS